MASREQIEKKIISDYAKALNLNVISTNLSTSLSNGHRSIILHDDKTVEDSDNLFTSWEVDFKQGVLVLS